MNDSASNHQVPGKRWISRKNSPPKDPVGPSAYERQKRKDAETNASNKREKLIDGCPGEQLTSTKSEKRNRSKPAPSEFNVKALLAEMKAAVHVLVDEQMDSMDVSNSPNAVESEITALTGILDLITEATIGDEAAINALVRISTRIGDALETIAKRENDPPVDLFSSTTPLTEIKARQSSPPIHVAFNGSLDRLERVLQSHREEIRSIVESVDRRKDFTIPRDYPDSLRVTAGRIEYFPDFEHTRLLPADETARLRKELEELERLRNGPKLFIPKKSSLDEIATRVVSHLTNTLVGNRLYQHLKEHSQTSLLTVARNSLGWPSRISAFPYLNVQTTDYEEFLSIGSALPFRLKPESGRSSKIKPTSAASFALSICLPIYQHRNLFRNCTKAERSKLTYWSEEFEAMVKKDKRAPAPGDKPVDFNIEQEITLGGKLYHCSLRSRWFINAILLPPFPTNEESGIQRERFASWKKVAIERAEYLCDGDWEGTKWPQCVEHSVNLKDDEKRFRTRREEVGSRLREGLRVLRTEHG